VVVALLHLSWSFKATAQTVQYVTLSATNGAASNYPLQTNQVVSLVGFDWSSGGSSFTITGFLSNGGTINLSPVNEYQPAGGVQMPQIATGLTNIVLGNEGAGYDYLFWATFQITTPASANVVSNYVPADAIVIPASATGNVQIILESSTDLVNWTAANPGTYGASSATNRFFRVRAVHN
jgi:hypothetical protein